nr:MAG TPA: hypothetical protein [Caudoviricetes sp.]
MAQKYIVDDVVMYKNKIHTIIDTLGQNNYELSYIRHPVNQAELSGVPITPEILEKNRWDKRTRVCNSGECLEDFSNSSFPLEHFAIAFTKEGIKATYDCLLIREVKYISDLQHLLFGLGLKHEMEV